MISREEQKEFIDFCSQFEEEIVTTHGKDGTMTNGRWMISEAPLLKTIDMIIDRSAAIIIPDRTFCLTGTMKNGKRKSVLSQLTAKGGKYNDNVTHSTDYLVIGALSNPCWAYSTYGRKIEKIMNGSMKAAIVHEDDFMQALLNT
jgi:NAD-dependent DNA ligase